MHGLDQNEDRPRGTYQFPFEFHHIDSSHPRYEMSYHWHMEYEIMRILSGSFTVTLDEKSFTAKAGDVIFVNSGILHCGIPDNGCVYQCIVFDINTFIKQNTLCGKYIQKIAHQDLMVYHHFTEKYPDILDAVNCIRISRTRRDYKRIQQLKQVVEFVEKNYASPLTLQQLSASVSMSPKYFCRFFSEMTHQTPMDYLNRQRIEEACFQLSTTDDSITEIAYRTGFNDLSYFIRTFRKYKGTTPGKYKKL